MSTSLKELARSFPKARGVFAYGSAAYQQPGLYRRMGANRYAPMLDMIFAADHPLAWHHENMARNADHYSMISSLHPSMLTAKKYGTFEHAPILQMCSLCEVIGRGVHFNAYATVGGQEIKYGVISTSALLRDLWTWENLFIAGRLHKPVLILTEDAVITDAVRANLDSALAAALLLLPERFSSQALMESVCGLSYTGDIRMAWGEDQQKVRRIVRGSWPDLIMSFLPRLKETIGCAAELSINCTSDTMCNLKWDAVMEQNSGLPQTELLLSFLPQVLQNSLSNTPNRHHRADAVSYRMAIAAALSEQLSLLVKRSSFHQAMWGFASAGPQKALRYAMAKISRGRGGC